jgi:hypothetical protein
MFFFFLLLLKNWEELDTTYVIIIVRISTLAFSEEVQKILDYYISHLFLLYIIYFFLPPYINRRTNVT